MAKLSDQVKKYVEIGFGNQKTADAFVAELETLGGGGAWGEITGTLSDQTDLQDVLDTKADLGPDGKVPSYQLPAGGPGSAEWGLVSGTLSDQTDLQAALDAVASSGATGDLQFSDGAGSFHSSDRLNYDGTKLVIASNGNTTDSDPNTHNLVIKNSSEVRISIGSDADKNFIQSWENKPLVINPLGNNVGINVDAPTEAFEVSGNIKASSALISTIVQTGSVLGGNGSPATPTYGFASDNENDTGMYWIGDGDLGFAVNGVEGMHLDGTGLHVTGDITASNFPIVQAANKFLMTDSAGAVTTLNEFYYDVDNYNGLRLNHGVVPVAGDNYHTVNNIYASYNPTVAGSEEGFNHIFIEAGIGTDDSGFQVGDAEDVKSTLVVGDITFTANRRGADGDVVSIQFIGGGTAGSEMLTDPTQFEYVLQIEDGVSTAAQIVAAITNQVGNEGNNIKAAVTGTGSNPQSVFAKTFLSGGVYNEGGISMVPISFYSRNKSSVGFLNGVSMDVDFGNDNDPIAGGSFRMYGGNVNLHANTTIDQLIGFDYGFNQNSTNGLIINDVRGVGIFGNLANVGGNIQAFNFGLNAVSAFSVNSFQTSMHVSGDVHQGVNAYSDFSNYNGDIGDNYYGLTIQPNINTVDGFFGINISPNITQTRAFSAGLNVNMNNINTYPGVKATAVMQDISFQAVAAGSGANGVTIEFRDDGTAGSETADLSGGGVVVHMQSGVSTATQIRTAMQASIPVAVNLTATISGTGSNPQVSGTVALSGGVNQGQKVAAQLNGDVQINGKTQAGGTLDTASGPPDFVYGLNSLGGTFHVAAGSPIVGGQFGILNNFGVGMDINDDIGPDQTGLNLGTNMNGFLTQVQIAAGKTMDALSFMTAGASVPTGSGNLTNLSMFRAIGLIPQGGSLNVTNVYGFKVEALLSATSPANSWGVFVDDGQADNYFAKSIAIATGSKKVSNSGVGLEIGGKALVNGSMSTAAKLALTGVAGMQVYDTDLNQLSYYNGTSWINI